MTLRERKYSRNLRDDAKFRRMLRDLVVELGCFVGLLGWMSFLAYLFLRAVFG